MEQLTSQPNESHKRHNRSASDLMNTSVHLPPKRQNMMESRENSTQDSLQDSLQDSVQEDDIEDATEVLLSLSHFGVVSEKLQVTLKIEELL